MLAIAGTELGCECRYVKGLVQQEIAAGTPANRIVVGGFSQGGVIALMMLREMKELAGVIGVERPPGCNVFKAMLCQPLPLYTALLVVQRVDLLCCHAGLSCYLPLRNASSVLVPEMKSVPVFMGHGTEDPLIPLTIGQMTYEVLQGLGSKIEMKRYPMAHSACPEEIQDVAMFLKRVIP